MFVHRTSVRVNVKSTTTDKHKQQEAIRYLKHPPITVLQPGEYNGLYTAPLLCTC